MSQSTLVAIAFLVVLAFGPPLTLAGSAGWLTLLAVACAYDIWTEMRK